jgi:hypothetical protein
MDASEDDWAEFLLMESNLYLKIVLYCNALELLFQFLISLLLHPSVSAWDLCCGTMSLFSPKKAAYLSKVLSDKFCPLHEYSNEILTAVGIWLDCRFETNIFCWVRHLGVVAKQHAIRIGYSVATTITNKVVDFYLIVWSRSRLLCCVGPGSNEAVS